MESSYLSWALECELDGAACHSYDDMRTSRVPPYQHKPPSSGADRTSSPSAASHAPNPTPCDLIQSMQCAIRHPEPAPVRSGQPSHGIRGTARDETLAVCQAGCSRWTSAARPDIPTHPSCRQLQGIREYPMVSATAAVPRLPDVHAHGSRRWRAVEVGASQWRGATSYSSARMPTSRAYPRRYFQRRRCAIPSPVGAAQAPLLPLVSVTRCAASDQPQKASLAC
jgi:hypothetical protein